jgi:hypothetical protein
MRGDGLGGESARHLTSRFNAWLGSRTIAQQLALFVLLTALPLLIANYVSLNRLAMNERESVRGYLTLNAKTLTGLVDNEIDTHAAVARTLSLSSALEGGDFQAF